MICSASTSFIQTPFTVFPNFNRNFASGTNAVWPRPSWPANGDIPESKISPLSETEPGAMDFKLWKLIGHQFMVKSNINHWIVCTEGEGSLVEYRKGSLNCHVVKIIAAAFNVIELFNATHYRSHYAHFHH